MVPLLLLLLLVLSGSESYRRYATGGISIKLHFDNSVPTRGDESRTVRPTVRNPKPQPKPLIDIQRYPSNILHNVIQAPETSTTHNNVNHRSVTSSTQNNVNHGSVTSSTHNNVNHRSVTSSTHNNVNHRSVTSSTHNNVNHGSETSSTNNNVNPGSGTSRTQYNVNPGSVTPTTHINVNHVSVTPSTQYNVNQGSETSSTQYNVNHGLKTSSTQNNVNHGLDTTSTQNNVNHGSGTSSTQNNVNHGSETSSTQYNVNPGSVTPSTNNNVNHGSGTSSTQNNVNPGSVTSSNQYNVNHGLKTSSTHDNVNHGLDTTSTQNNVNSGSVTSSTQNNVNHGLDTTSTQNNVNSGSVTTSTQYNVNPGSETSSTHNNVNHGSVTSSTQYNVNHGSETSSTQNNVNPGSVTSSTQYNVNPGSVASSTQNNVNSGSETSSTHNNVNHGSGTSSTQNNVNPGSVISSTHNNVNPGSVTSSTQYNANPGSVTSSTHNNVLRNIIQKLQILRTQSGSTTSNSYPTQPHASKSGTISDRSLIDLLKSIDIVTNSKDQSLGSNNQQNPAEGYGVPANSKPNPLRYTDAPKPEKTVPVHLKGRPIRYGQLVGSDASSVANSQSNPASQTVITEKTVPLNLDIQQQDRPTRYGQLLDTGVSPNVADNQSNPVLYETSPPNQFIVQSGTQTGSPSYGSGNGNRLVQTNIPQATVTSTQQTSGCLLRSWPGKLTSYYHVQAQSVEIACAPGTVFSQSHCVCIHAPLGMELNLQPTYQNIVPQTQKAACYLQAVSGRPTQYLDIETERVMPCSPGTIFSQEVCTCIHDEDIIDSSSSSSSSEECDANYDLNFDGSWLQNNNRALPVGGGWTVKLRDGSGQFNSRSTINFWSYQGRPYDKIFSIQMEFKDLPSDNARQSLLTNCGTDLDEEEPSLLIELNKDNKAECHLRIMVVTGPSGQKSEMTLPIRSGEYNMLSLEYNNGFISAFVGYESGETVSNQLQCGGDIVPSISDLRLGTCDQKDNGFVGLINWFKMYPCIIG